MVSSDAQKEKLAHFCFEPPTRATTCASVMKEPSTVSLPPCSLNEASSVLMFTARLGADKKLYICPCLPVRKTAGVKKRNSRKHWSRRRVRRGSLRGPRAQSGGGGPGRRRRSCIAASGVRAPAARLRSGRGTGRWSRRCSSCSSVAAAAIRRERRASARGVGGRPGGAVPCVKGCSPWERCAR